MIVIIDNFDSFTYNLVDLVRQQTDKFKVITADMALPVNASKFVISPGPSHPKNASLSLKAIEFAEKYHIPLLGVCLGHQAIGYYFGCDVGRNPKPMHGKISEIEHFNDYIFSNLPKTFTVTRYHSLVINKIKSDSIIKVTAMSLDDNQIMAIKHKSLPIYGVQFHPESVTSKYGSDIINNFMLL